MGILIYKFIKLVIFIIMILNFVYLKTKVKNSTDTVFINDITFQKHIVMSFIIASIIYIIFGTIDIIMDIFLRFQ